MKKINFMLTAFRDGFQSVYGARVFSSDYLPCVEFAARECGITHFEAGGGAMFQSPFFYSNENAFDVMDAFRKAAGPDAILQTLSRGINVVALKAQPQDIIKLHAAAVQETRHDHDPEFRRAQRRSQPHRIRPLHRRCRSEARGLRHHDGTAARLPRRA